MSRRRIPGSGKEQSEFALINWLVSWLSRNKGGKGIILGAGDDCAIIRAGRSRLLLTTDSLVEGVHFERGWLSATELGRRGFLVAASDLAAMGGAPRAALLSLEIPSSTPAAYLQSIIKGFAVACRRHGAELVGGNICRAPAIGIDAFLLGEPAQVCLARKGARPGDRIFVSGTPGDAGGGLALLRCGTLAKQRQRSSARRLVRRWITPPARFALARLVASRKLARAMIDISDGLLQDLSHICQRSGVGAVVASDKLPLSGPLRREFGDQASAYALGGGEDYELLLAVPKRLDRELAALAPRAGCQLTDIGEFVSGAAVELTDSQGRKHRLRQPLGFDHLREDS